MARGSGGRSCEAGQSGNCIPPEPNICLARYRMVTLTGACFCKPRAATNFQFLTASMDGCTNGDAPAKAEMFWAAPPEFGVNTRTTAPVTRELSGGAGGTAFVNVRAGASQRRSSVKAPENIEVFI